MISLEHRTRQVLDLYLNKPTHDPRPPTSNLRNQLRKAEELLEDQQDAWRAEATSREAAHQKEAAALKAEHAEAMKKLQG